jgi:rhodanese-related sulfurtransferase
MPVTSESVSFVTDIAPASALLAREHFAHLLALETDCWDVHAALEAGQTDIVLLDVRSIAAFRAGHIPGAINLPHREITAVRLAVFSEEALLVVYCAGPHCNGADRGALRIAKLGRPVKKMIGGITGWLDEGFPLVRSSNE